MLPELANESKSQASGVPLFGFCAFTEVKRWPFLWDVHRCRIMPQNAKSLKAMRRQHGRYGRRVS